MHPVAVGPGWSVRSKARGRAQSRRAVEAQTTPISNARLAMVMFLVAETMFFSGLIGAYLVFRFGSRTWPPPDLPRLPVEVSWVSTGVLSVSALALLAALQAVRGGDQLGLRRGLAVTLVLGCGFLLAQGSEWLRLVGHGLTLTTGTYGATFYGLIGAHAVHVLGAVVWLGIVAIRAQQGRFTAARHVGVELCAVYWFFVCALWLALFALVYQR